ncbi:MAG: hypothetical protein MJE68_22625, partial [Proteobacteria bacterium]|nr:hypothetical protein [Pseudomonadota bacterium]
MSYLKWWEGMVDILIQNSPHTRMTLHRTRTFIALFQFSLSDGLNFSIAAFVFKPLYYNGKPL